MTASVCTNDIGFGLLAGFGCDRRSLKDGFVVSQMSCQDALTQGCLATKPLKLTAMFDTNWLPQNILVLFINN